MNDKLLLALDLDGTLVKTHAALEFAYTEALKEIHIKVNNLDFLNHGFSFDQICQEIGIAEADKKLTLKIAKDKYYLSNLSLTNVNEPIFNLMRSVSRFGKIGIVTNARRYSAIKLLQWHELIKYVDYLISSDDVEKRKPDPEPYLKLLEISGFDSHNVIAVEDSEIGKISALSAQITTLLLTY